MSEPIVRISNLSYAYRGATPALRDVSLDVRRGEILGLLGPNGSGKTTLFRILSTLLPPPAPGTVRMFGVDLACGHDVVRKRIGVVFQSPSIDPQLTARENLLCHGAVYGLGGTELRRRTDDLLAWVKLLDRADERTNRFSGGMRRRVELAKSMLHRPELLIMDEPSTGLDPGARLDLWDLLRHLKSEGTTVLLTTHLMDEADRCERVAILDSGQLLVCGTPSELKAQLGGDAITVTSQRMDEVRIALRAKLQIDQEPVGNTLHLQQPSAHQLVPRLIDAAPGLIDSVSVGRPTLEDVFIKLTGREYCQDESPMMKTDVRTD
jgi:ABC-2 type transport system ATP-binding protein